MALINRAYSEIVKIRKQYPVYDRLPDLKEHQESQETQKYQETQK